VTYKTSNDVCNICFSSVYQGDIQALYDSIDKETPTGTDRQVSITQSSSPSLD